MWKNKEIRGLTYTILMINVLAIMISMFISMTTFIFMICICFSFDITIFLYTRHRYQEIQKLSAYLMQIYAGGTSLDIRDNREGELSILKNDIYKVTQTLMEQSEYLHEDKIFLAQTLSDISHQLKTPLTSMMVLCDVLNDEDISIEKQKEFMKGMHTQLERMQWLIKSLLTLSRIDARALVFKEETIFVNDLFSSCMQSFSILMELKELHCTIHCDSLITILGDKHWLQEAISNIIKNAIEHTPIHGEIHIDCEDNPLQTKIIIMNKGMKISKKDLLHIFDRFYKGENASSDSIGIGLALSKSIIQHQNGQILCESSDEETKFIINLYKHTV